MTEDESRKARYNRLMALSPRNEQGLIELLDYLYPIPEPPRTDGLINPMVFYYKPREVQYYPVVIPDEYGRERPKPRLEDFVDGIPSYIRYEPGFQRENVPITDPRYLESIEYLDPMLNLPPDQRRAVEAARNSGRVPMPTPASFVIGGRFQAEDLRAGALQAEVVRHLSAAGGKRDLPILDGEVVRPKEEEKTRAPVAAEEEITTSAEVVCITPGQLHVRTSSGDVFLAQFSVTAVEHRIVHKDPRDGGIVDEYELKIQSEGRTKSLVIPPKDIDNVITLVQRALPMAYITHEIKKANTLIVNYVRKQLSSLPHRHYIETGGFMKLNGIWFFPHDGLEPPMENLIFRTGRTIPHEPSVSPRDAYIRMKEILHLSPRLELMAPLLLVAHLSPMFNLFVEAGHVPRFVTFLAGRSGSLKTSMALALFRLFQEQPDSPSANFKDTETALEIKMGEANGQVVLLDDFRPPVIAAEGKTYLAKLESVIRAAGDRIGKSRSNAELGKAKEFLPTGLVVVTGEDLGGSQSSLLRMLVLPISKGDIDGKKLKKFQDNSMILYTHYYYFLRSAGAIGDGIIQFIRDNFEGERTFFGSVLAEPRVVDTAATLMLTARILHQYGVSVGAESDDPEVSKRVLGDWRQAILRACSASEQTSRTQDPVKMFLQAYFTLMDRSEIVLAIGAKAFLPGQLGYVQGDELWLWPHETYTAVTRYWQRQGVLFPLSLDQLNQHLEAAGLIKVTFETRNGGKKKLYGIKSGLPKRNRLMVLNEPLARKYLEEH